MKDRTLKTRLFLQCVATLAIVMTLIFYIQKDFVKVRKFFIANPLVHGLQVQRDQVKNKAMLITINHYRPDLSQWENYFANKTPPSKSFLNDSVRYYETISQYAPQIAETYHLMAVCHDLLGDKDKALANQSKAVNLESHYFTALYNLGILYYRRGEYSKSAEAFGMALKTRPTDTAKFLSSSRILIEIIRSIESTDVLTPKVIQDGYHEAAQMLQASIKRLRGQPVDIREEQMQLKVF